MAILTATSSEILLICHPLQVSLLYLQVREVRRLLLDLDSYDGTDPLGMFPLDLKMPAEDQDPGLGVVF